MAPPPQEAISTLTRRFIAWLVDLVVIGGPVAVLTLAVSDIDLGAREFDTPTWVTLLGWTSSLGYQIVLVARTGQTLGKAACGLRVVDLDSWRVPSPTRAAARVLPQLLGLLPAVNLLAPAVYLPMLWRADQRGLHDMLAGTVVVRSDYPGSHGATTLEERR